MRQLGQLTFDEWFMMDVSPDKAMMAVALHHLPPLLSYPNEPHAMYISAIVLKQIPHQSFQIYFRHWPARKKFPIPDLQPFQKPLHP